MDKSSKCFVDASLASEIFARLGTAGISELLEMREKLNEALNYLAESGKTPLDFMHLAFSMDENCYHTLLRDVAMIEHIRAISLSNSMLSKDDLENEVVHIVKRIPKYLPLISECPSCASTHQDILDLDEDV